MKATTKRWLLRSCGALVIAWLAFVGFIDWAMHQPPEVFGRVMMHMPMPAYFLFPFETMWTQARFGHVNPGDAAPTSRSRRWRQDFRCNWRRCGPRSRSCWCLGAIPDRLFGGRFPP